MKKIISTFVFASLLCAPTQGYANSDEESNIGFYVGLGGGLVHLSGTRKDLLITESGAVPSVDIPAAKRLRGNDALVEVFIGIEVKPKELGRFSFCLEHGLSYSRVHHNTYGSVVNVGQNVDIQSKEGLFLDFVPKYQLLENLFFLVSCGIETRFFRLEHIDADGLKVEAQRNLYGFSYGIGLEKAFEQVSVGLRFKYRTYNKRSIMGSDGDGTTIKSIIFPRLFSAMFVLIYKI